MEADVKLPQVCGHLPQSRGRLDHVESPHYVLREAALRAASVAAHSATVRTTHLPALEQGAAVAEEVAAALRDLASFVPMAFQIPRAPIEAERFDLYDSDADAATEIGYDCAVTPGEPDTGLGNIVHSSANAGGDAAAGSAVTADVISSNAAISACEKGGQGLRTSAHHVISHNAAISACDTSCTSDACNGNTHADVISSNAAISTCEKGGQGLQTSALHVVSHNAAISACDKGLPYALRRHIEQSDLSGCSPAHVISQHAAISAGAQDCKRDTDHVLRSDGSTTANVISHNVAISMRAATSACAKGGQCGQALGLPHKMRIDSVPDSVPQDACEKGGSGDPANVVSFSAAFSACEKGGAMAMQQRRRVPDPICLSELPRPPEFGSCVDVCGTGGHGHVANVVSFSAAFSADAPGIEHPGTTAYVISPSAAISTCEKGEQWEPSLTFLPKMHDCSTHVISHDAAISVCAQSERPIEATAHDSANVISFNAESDVKDACEKRGHGHTANLVSFSAAFSADTPGIEDSGTFANVISPSAAISTCGKGEQWEPALALLPNMRDVGTHVISHGAAISVCAKSEHPPEAANGGPAKVISFNAESGHMDACDKGRPGHEPNVVSCSAAISADAPGIVHPGTTADVISLCAAISTCIKGEQWEQALTLLQRRGGGTHVVGQNAGMTAHVINNSAAISASEKGSQCAQALAPPQPVMRGGARDVISFNAASSSACEKGGNEVVSSASSDHDGCPDGSASSEQDQHDVISNNSAISVCSEGLVFDGLPLARRSLVDHISQAEARSSAISACEKGVGGTHTNSGTQDAHSVDAAHAASEGRAGTVANVVSFSTASSTCDR